MASLSTFDKQILESLFQMGKGYVLDFTDQSMREFFNDDVDINIYDQEYNFSSGSKANRIRGLWTNADDNVVAKSISSLVEYIENQIFLKKLNQSDFPVDQMNIAMEIAARLSGSSAREESKSQATFNNGSIVINLQKDVFDHVQKFLNDGHFFNAVEEAYKIVRKKLKEITGKERATDAFSRSNYEMIFGHQPRNEAEKDFFEGVKYLHMAIQFLRNEKSHTPAHELDKNLAAHYISLASLAYDLISRK
jgi:uncharacterized protein (TIGR02391 family)